MTGVWFSAGAGIFYPLLSSLLYHGYRG